MTFEIKRYRVGRHMYNEKQSSKALSNLKYVDHLVTCLSYPFMQVQHILVDVSLVQCRFVPRFICMTVEDVINRTGWFYLWTTGFISLFLIFIFPPFKLLFWLILHRPINMRKSQLGKRLVTSKKLDLTPAPPLFLDTCCLKCIMWNQEVCLHNMLRCNGGS